VLVLGDLVLTLLRVYGKAPTKLGLAIGDRSDDNCRVRCSVRESRGKLPVNGFCMDINYDFRRFQ